MRKLQSKSTSWVYELGTLLDPLPNNLHESWLFTCKLTTTGKSAVLIIQNFCQVLKEAALLDFQITDSVLSTEGKVTIKFGFNDERVYNLLYLLTN